MAHNNKLLPLILILDDHIFQRLTVGGADYCALEGRRKTSRLLGRGVFSSYAKKSVSASISIPIPIHGD